MMYQQNSCTINKRLITGESVKPKPKPISIQMGIQQYITQKSMAETSKKLLDVSNRSSIWGVGQSDIDSIIIPDCKCEETLKIKPRDCGQYETMENSALYVEKVAMLNDVKDKSTLDEEMSSHNAKKLSYHEIAECLLLSGNWKTENGMLLYYVKEKGFWKLIPKNNENRELRGCISKEYVCEINKNSLAEIYEWLVLEATPFVENPRSKEYLNLQDGAVLWSDGCTIEKDRKGLGFRYYLNASTEDLNATSTGRFKEYIESLFPYDKKTLREFKKCLGIILSGYRNLKLSFIFHGPSNTGKTVMLNLLGKMFGPENVSYLSFSQLSKEFALTQLLGKAVNITGEISGTNNNRLDVFKSITGRDSVTMCFKNKDHIHSSLHCLLLFASNVFPQIADSRELQIFLKRVVIFPFDNVVERKHWIEDFEDVLYEDRGFILKTAMEGLRKLEKDRFEVIESKAMLSKKKDFQGEFDSFSLFLEECLEKSPKSKISSKEIAQYYSKYCSEQGLIEQASNVWPVILKQSFPVKSVIIEKTDPLSLKRTRNRGYVGIAFKELVDRTQYPDELNYGDNFDDEDDY